MMNLRKMFMTGLLAVLAGAPAFSQKKTDMDRIDYCKQNYRALFGGEP